MAYAPAAPDLERLPWLTDDPTAAPRSDLRPLIGWSLVAALLIAAASYWLGMTAAGPVFESGEDAEAAATATIALPEPYNAEPVVEEVKPVMPQVAPVAAPPPVEIRTSERRETRRVRRTRRPLLERTPIPDESLREVVSKQEAKAQADEGETEANEAEPKKAETKREVAALWPASQSEGATGRVVRIGTFTSRLQAKRAWHRVIRAFPGMRRLNAVVVGNESLRNGRTYYRLQFGTSSQAHSTVLCQRMRTIGQSCVVVGLPGGVA